MKSAEIALVVVRWFARITALGLFILWGMFFVEHVQEWFLHPKIGFPPVDIWLFQLAHFVTLVGLLLLWKWEIGGSLVTLAGALAFFGGLALKQMLAGHGYSTFLIFLAITITPAVLTLICHFAQPPPLNMPETLPPA